jgi:hypothetical protein
MATTHPEVRGFSSPFEVPVPEGCEGWESMYPAIGCASTATPAP